MTTLRELVEAQANDDGLWFNAQTAPEAYLQQELRRLHAAVEAALAEFGASLTDPTNISVHQTAEPSQPFCYLKQTSSSENPPHGWAVHFTEGDVALYTAPQPPADEVVETVQPVAEFHAHPADWQYNITLLPGVPMLLDGTKLYPAPQPPGDVPRLSDEDFEKLIDNSDARWAEDVYVIDSGSVIDLLRAVEAEVRRRCGVVE